MEATFGAELGPQTVLVVDHDLKGRSLLQSRLEADGYAVMFAGSASEAMTLLRPGRPLPSMIVAEAEPPGDDGFELCARVRADGRTAVLPLILLSKTADVSRKSRAGAVGADDFVARPVYANDIVALVKLFSGGSLPNAEVVVDTEELPVHRVVRALLSGVRSGKLQTEDGHVSFRDGRIVDARFRNVRGSVAVTRILLLTDGEYSVAFGPTVGHADFSIGLEEFCRRFDSSVSRFNEVASRAVPIDAVLAVEFPKLAENLASLPDEVNTLVRLFDGHRQVRDVILESSFSEVTALEAATRLYTLGVLAPVWMERKEPVRKAPRFMEPDTGAGRALDELFGMSAPPVPELEPLPVPDWIVDRMSPELQAQLDAFNTRLVPEPQPVREMHLSQMEAFSAGLDSYDRSLEDAINASLVSEPGDEEPLELLTRKEQSAVDVEFDIDVTEPEAAADEAFFIPTGEMQLPVEEERDPRRPMLGALAITVGVVVLAAGIAFTVARPEAAKPAVAPVAHKPVAILMPETVVVPAPAAEGPSLEQGIAFYEAGFTEDAVTLLEQVVLRDDAPEAWSMLGVARFDAGDAKGAEAAAKKTLELDAKNGQARMLLASIYIAWREHDLADAQLKAYLEHEPNGVHANEARDLLTRKKLPKKVASEELQ